LKQLFTAKNIFFRKIKREPISAFGSSSKYESILARAIHVSLYVMVHIIHQVNTAYNYYHGDYIMILYNIIDSTDYEKSRICLVIIMLPNQVTQEQDNFFFTRGGKI